MRPTLRPEWEYVPEGWTRPHGGWNVEAIARAYREKWASFLAATSGPGPLGVDHEVQAGVPVARDVPAAEHTILAFGYVLARAAHGASRLSLLDWGGGPGHYAILARRLLPEVVVDYHSRDLPALVKLGRELLPGETFHSDDSCLQRSYDLVVASGSLHYEEDWQARLSALAAATGQFLFVTRVPTVSHSASFVLLQRAYSYGYETEYLGWALNRDEVIATAGSIGLELVREFVLPPVLEVAGAPETPVLDHGYLFAPDEGQPNA